MNGEYHGHGRRCRVRRAGSKLVEGTKRTGSNEYGDGVTGRQQARRM